MEERSRWGDRTLYFLLGGFVGATVALLFAPRSGEETREMIATKVKDGTEALKDHLQTARQKLVETKDKLESDTADLISRGKEMVAREKEVISAAIEAGKQAYMEEKESVKKKI